MLTGFFINRIIINEKLYCESTKKLVYQKRGVLFLSIILCLFLVLLGVVAMASILNGFGGDWQKILLSPAILVFASFFLIALLGVVLFFCVLNPHRLVVRNKEVPHKEDFFRNSVDGEQVEYCTIIDGNGISIEMDGEVEEVKWNEIVGTRETRHFLLLVTDATISFRGRSRKGFIKRITPVFIEHAAVIDKNGFMQGNLSDFRRLLVERGITRLPRRHMRGGAILDVRA